MREGSLCERSIVDRFEVNNSIVGEVSEMLGSSFSVPWSMGLR